MRVYLYICIQGLYSLIPYKAPASLGNIAVASQKLSAHFQTGRFQCGCFFREAPKAERISRNPGMVGSMILMSLYV